MPSIRLLPNAMSIFQFIDKSTHTPSPSLTLITCLSVGDLLHGPGVDIHLASENQSPDYAYFPPGSRGVLITHTRYFAPNICPACRGIRHPLPGPGMDVCSLVRLYHEAKLWLSRSLLVHLVKASPGTSAITLFPLRDDR